MVAHGGDGAAMTSSEESFRKLSANVLYEDEGYGMDWTFHSRCKVREKVCAMSIDRESLINTASIELIEKLELPMMRHPQFYVLKWYSGVLKITNQVKAMVRRTRSINIELAHLGLYLYMEEYTDLFASNRRSIDSR